MRVIEQFDSIQGEGIFIGRPCTFVRLAGCNLTCEWCDTKNSWDPKAGQELEITQIVAHCYNGLVVITGGEPCMNHDLFELVQRLQMEGHKVNIETNGTLPTPDIADWVTASPKPQSKYMIHPKCKADELKYVVDDEFDVDEAIPEDVRVKFAGRIWLQPEGGNMMDSWNDCIDLAMHDARLRVGMQLHKILEVR